MSQPSSILNFPGNNQGSKLKPSSPLVAKAAATATEIAAPNSTSVDKRGLSEAKIKPASGAETVATVSTASFVSPNPSRFKTPQDENQALSLISAKESPSTSTPPMQTQGPQARGNFKPTESPSQPNLLPAPQLSESIKIPDNLGGQPRFPKTSGESPCDTGPNTSTNITLPSIAFARSTVSDPNCPPAGFASLDMGMNSQRRGGSYLNGSEFRRDQTTATEYMIQLKDQNLKLKAEKEYLKDTAETLSKQLRDEQTARQQAEIQFDEIQIENKDQRKVIAQLQLAYENLANRKIEVEKEYDNKLREIETTLDKALLEAMYDASDKQ